MKDFSFLIRCFDLARLGNGFTSPNPSVGAVIVAPDGRIIGEGWHQKYGTAHAEVNAVASIEPEDKHLLSKSTIYVSLEPCFHTGKTPPCVELIIKERISRVVIASVDPFPAVAGKSIIKLLQNGVEVSIFHKNTEGGKFVQLNLTNCENYLSSSEPNAFDKDLPLQFDIQTPFFTNVKKRRPYVILKWAESADGFIGREGEETPISNAYAKRLTHKWRSECDAIMVGTNTALVDNPELTNRYFYGKSPKRVVLDRTRRLPNHLYLFDNCIKTMVYTENTIHHPNTEGVEHRMLKFDESLLENLLTDLYEQKIGILLVEGGQRLLQSFITTKLWDEARVFRAQSALGSGVCAPKIDISKFCQMVQLIDNQLVIFRNI
jgi:diaminohydroxyphosphoribosylaminopyrimidine deaminase / 5-amino-6-(5-phosphoribosylamino)uracil reductase